MERDVGDLMKAWMGMQKLATTPFPFPWIQTLITLMYLWMYTIPFPLVNQYGWVGPPVAGLLGVAIFGLWYIGCELEDPFGEETNDLDLEFFEAACTAASKAMLPKMLEKVDMLPPPPTAAAIMAGVQPSWSLPVQHSEVKATPAPSAAPPAPAAAPPSDAAIQTELATCVEYAQLNKSLQALLQEHFRRFDHSGNGRIDDDKELTQLVTNLVFTLKLSAHLMGLMAEVDKVSANGAVLGWDLPTFTRWFLRTVQIFVR